MEPFESIERIKQTFASAVRNTDERGVFPFVEVKVDSLKEILSYCVHDSSMKFDFLDCITVLDTGPDIVLIYQLFSTILAHRINIKTSVSHHEARVPSVTGFWRAATAYEREAHEMFGVKFDGHRELSNLLLPEDWHGNPLRKDYVYPQDYRGVEHRRSPLRKEHTRP